MAIAYKLGLAPALIYMNNFPKLIIASFTFEVVLGCIFREFCHAVNRLLVL